MISPLKVKDVAAVLDYTFNYADASNNYLGTDTIASSSWAVSPSGLTITSPAASFTATTTTVWASSGTVGKLYVLTNHITTAAGRTEERSFELLVDNL